MRIADQPVIVGTHSPAFLNMARASLLHVVRDANGETTVKGLDTIDDGDIDEVVSHLGMRRSDLLLYYRTFLLVEGDHDFAVLGAIIGEELARERVCVVPISGAHRVMTVADAHVLVDLTDASIVVALDSLQSDITTAYETSKATAEAGDLKKAQRSVLQAGDSQKAEARLARSLAHRALAVGTANRLQIFGFEKRDIVQYLPVIDLVDTDKTWDQLVTAWRDSMSATGGRIAFKTWLRQECGAQLGVADLVRSAEGLDSDVLHPDFARLLAVCRGSAGGDNE